MGSIPIGGATKQNVSFCFFVFGGFLFYLQCVPRKTDKFAPEDLICLPQKRKAFGFCGNKPDVPNEVPAQLTGVGELPAPVLLSLPFAGDPSSNFFC